MPQVLKESVRSRILAATRAELAERGFPGSTVATIASRARLGTGSVYRYYASKEELVDAAIPPKLARELESLLDRRVRALGATLTRSKDDGGEEIFRFWRMHRLAVVVLLDRAEGTAHEDFPKRFVDRLVDLSMRQLRAGYPSVKIDETTRFVLRRIFEATRATLAAILREHEGEGEMRAAIEAFWTYQIAGLKALSKRVGTPSSRRRVRGATS